MNNTSHQVFMEAVIFSMHVKSFYITFAYHRTNADRTVLLKSFWSFKSRSVACCLTTTNLKCFWKYIRILRKCHDGTGVLIKRNRRKLSKERDKMIPCHINFEFTVNKWNQMKDRQSLKLVHTSPSSYTGNTDAHTSMIQRVALWTFLMHVLTKKR